MFRIRWDEVSGTVASALDAVGVAILVGYVLFSLNRGRIAEIWFDGPIVGVVSLAALAARWVANCWAPGPAWCGRCAGPVSSARPRTTGSRHARRHRAPAHGLLGIRPAWRATFTRSMPFTSVCGGRCG